MIVMNKLIVPALVFGAVLVSAQGNKPFAADTQIKLLKAQREIQQQRIKIADLQRQFDQATAAIKQSQAEMEAECTAAAKAAAVDLTKYSCDLDQLAFVPKPAAPAPPAEKK